MPILDWTRTDLDAPMKDGSTGLRFDATHFAAFDLYLLERPEAQDLYTEEQKIKPKYGSTMRRSRRSRNSSVTLLPDYLVRKRVLRSKNSEKY
jgi:D-mannonate dehydratase